MKARRKTRVAAAGVRCIQVISIFDVVASSSYCAKEWWEKAQGRGVREYIHVHTYVRSRWVCKERGGGKTRGRDCRAEWGAGKDLMLYVITLLELVEGVFICTNSGLLASAQRY
jgi:hypothetical protein